MQLVVYHAARKTIAWIQHYWGTETLFLKYTVVLLVLYSMAKPRQDHRWLAECVPKVQLNTVMYDNYTDWGSSQCGTPLEPVLAGLQRDATAIS
jgi:hypothetical protein